MTTAQITALIERFRFGPVSDTSTSAPAFDSDEFVRDLLEHLPAVLQDECWQESDRLARLLAAVRWIFRAVQGAGRWPVGQPEGVFAALVARACDLAPNWGERGSKELSGLLEVLRVMLAECGTKDRVAEPLFRDAQRELVELLRGAISRDAPNFFERQARAFGVYSPDRPRAIPIALLLSANYGLIIDVRQRLAVVETLRKLSTDKVEGYDNPFIKDLIFIFDRMHMSRLEGLFMQTGADDSVR